MIDGENGRLVSDELEMAAALGDLNSIHPVQCRATVAERYDVATTASGYERVYRRAAGVERTVLAAEQATRAAQARPAIGRN